MDPLLADEDKLAINQLMVISTFVALYFMLFLLLVYLVLAPVLYRKDATPLERRNVWLSENDSSHGFAYLLTITTGTQNHAHTRSNVSGIYQSVMNGWWSMNKILSSHFLFFAPHTHHACL